MSLLPISSGHPSAEAALSCVGGHALPRSQNAAEQADNPFATRGVPMGASISSMEGRTYRDAGGPGDGRRRSDEMIRLHPREMLGSSN
jgi:hypothetical protein